MTRLEKRLSPGELFVRDLCHDPRRVFMGDNVGSKRLEHRISVSVIAVKMRVHHPFDRLVGDLTNSLEQILAIARMLAGIDNQHAIIGH